MAGKVASGNDRRPVIIRREEVIEGGHHGGAWKVAYADFVTAMMAFFLLMWLLNATTEAQRRGLADYLSPLNVMSHNSSGSGKPFGGLTPFSKGDEVSDKGVQSVMPGAEQPPPQPSDSADMPSPPQASAADEDGRDGHTGQALQKGERSVGGGQAVTASTVPARADYLAQAASGSQSRLDPAAKDPTSLSNAALQNELARREKVAFQSAAQTIRAAVQADPALADLAHQLAIDVTPQGLRIQLMDADHQPMFATGSSVLTDQARELVAKIAPVLAKLSEPITVTGHTDAEPYRGGEKTNFELSAERANATRRLLVESGLDEGRFQSIAGDADRDPLMPADPMAAANRRVSILVLRAQTMAAK
jgi:chemotaxis protein MotB